MSKKIEWLDRTLLRMPYLVLCLNEKQYLKAIKHIRVPNPDIWLASCHEACVHTLAHPEGGTCCIVCMELVPNHDPVLVAGILVHEAVHVWQRYCDSIGETSAGREMEAYCIQQIAHTLFRSYVKQTNTKWLIA